jgi:hypothetical protein
MKKTDTGETKSSIPAEPQSPELTDPSWPMQDNLLALQSMRDEAKQGGAAQNASSSSMNEGS